jgi:hypothetical protein
VENAPRLKSELAMRLIELSTYMSPPFYSTVAMNRLLLQQAKNLCWEQMAFAVVNFEGIFI